MTATEWLKLKRQLEIGKEGKFDDTVINAILELEERISKLENKSSPG